MVDPNGELDLSGANIEVFPNPGARGGAGLNTAHYQSVSGPLFPKDPAIDDIQQQQLADCFLLAGVLAILTSKGGPETVAGLMKEANGRVVVRLYDNTLKARYVSIEKSIRKNEEKHNGGAIWATLLEKAYAAATFADVGNKGDKDKENLVGYARLNVGGHSDAVFKTLLGKQVDLHTITGAAPFDAFDRKNKKTSSSGLCGRSKMRRTYPTPRRLLRSRRSSAVTETCSTHGCYGERNS